MKQHTLAMAADQHSGFERHRRPTRRDVFLATMEQIVPWSALRGPPRSPETPQTAVDTAVNQSIDGFEPDQPSARTSWLLDQRCLNRPLKNPT